MTLQLPKNIPAFKPQKDAQLDWSSFNGGWNTFKRQTELNANELAQADNMMLVGQGTPTSRWGSTVYNMAGSGRIRLLDAYYNSLTSVNYLLSVTDSGMFAKKSGASYTIITGASFPSGAVLQSTELGANTFIAAASQNFIKFNGTNLIPYVGLSLPTNVSVAFLSGATGFSTYGWRITALSQSGETTGSQEVQLSVLPLNLASVSIKVSWNTVSAAPSVLTGYNIYRGFLGSETYLASADPSATSFLDTGQPASEVTFPPFADTTAGPKAKYILKVEDRLILAGIAGEPSKLYISARYPFHDRFTVIDGGNYAYVSPDDGEEITGLGLQTLQSTHPLIIVYKQNSTYVMDLTTVTLGNFVILEPQIHLLTRTAGSSSGDTVVAVENDVYSFGTKGMYSTGQEAQYLNQIRSNELSARIRPYVQSLSPGDFKEANAAYLDYKYILSFPSRKETVIFDRQRQAFMGPWKTPFGIVKWLRYFDTTGAEVRVAGGDNGNIYQFSDAFTTDSGTAISKILRTKKESLGTWNTMKMLKYFYFLLRNVKGSVTMNLRIEDRTGNTVTTKTATITSSLGDGGWGGDEWGDQQWGQSNASVILSGDELAYYSLIFKQFRVMQVEVTASGSTSNFELLSIKATGVDLGPASLPSKLKV